MNAGVISGNMIWLDVEEHDLYYDSCDDNEWYIGQLMRGMIDMVGDSGVGVYTNWYQWSDIMCDSCSWNTYPLWYPHYDNWDSFGDFQ